VKKSKMAQHSPEPEEISEDNDFADEESLDGDEALPEVKIQKSGMQAKSREEDEKVLKLQPKKVEIEESADMDEEIGDDFSEEEELETTEKDQRKISRGLVEQALGYGDDEDDFSVHDADESIKQEEKQIPAKKSPGTMGGGNSTVNMGSVVPQARPIKNFNPIHKKSPQREISPEAEDVMKEVNMQLDQIKPRYPQNTRGRP